MTERETTNALLDAAEAAFAERGIDGASLRSIMRAAGANTAAVHYHYGSRNELARAVLERVLTPLQTRRLELLDTAIGKDPLSVEQLMEALIRPDFEACVAAGERNPEGARLIGAIYSRPSDFVKSLVEESFAPVANRFHPHLCIALPDLHQGELSWRIRWAVFGILGALFSDTDVTIHTDNMEAELGRVLAACVGAVSAPPTKEPL